MKEVYRVTISKVQVTYMCPSLDKEVKVDADLSQTWYEDVHNYIYGQEVVFEAECECGKQHECALPYNLSQLKEIN